MSKRNITFTRPAEPKFLKKLKQAAGYKEGPTVDTKREDLGPAEDIDELEDERPTVVVLNPGDLTEAEAQKELTDQLNAPADLKDRIVFKPRSKKAPAERKKSGKKAEKSLLSFGDDIDEEDS